MVPDFRRFLAATNVLWPIPLPPAQRRCVLVRFNHEIAQRLEVQEFREAYLVRLDKVLNNTQVMTQLAHFILREYNPRPRRELLERTIHTQRRFNFETLETQLNYLRNDQNTSVLGWMYQHLVNFDDFFGDKSTEHYVLPPGPAETLEEYARDPKRARPAPRSDFVAWQRHLDLCFEKNAQGDTVTCKAPNDFTGRWRDTTESPNATYAQRCAQRRNRTHGWWSRGSKADFYASYKNVIPERAQLNVQEFGESCRHILGSNYGELAGQHAQYLLEASERKNGITRDVWCIADLEALEQAFKNAMPNAHELDWDSHRLNREKSKLRMQL